MKHLYTFLILGGLYFSHAHAQTYDSYLQNSYEEAYAFLVRATNAQEAKAAESLLNQYIFSLNALGELAPEDLPKDFEVDGAALDSFRFKKAQHLYTGAIWLIGLLQMPGNYPLLDSRKLYETSLSLLGHSRKLFEQSGLLEPGHQNLFRTYTNECKAHSWFLNYHEADQAFEKGISEAQKYKGDPSDKQWNSLLGDLYREKGQLLAKQGSFYEALNYYYQAQQKYELAGDTYYGASCIYKMCYCFLATENLDKALEYGKQLKEILPAYSQDPYFQSWVMDVNQYLYQAYEKKGEYRLALTELDQVLSNPFADAKYRGYALAGKGMVLLSMKAYPEARREIEKALAIYSGLQKNSSAMKRVHSGNYFVMGRYFEEVGKPDSAILCYDSALFLNSPGGSASLVWDDFKVSEYQARKAACFFQKYETNKKESDLKKSDSIYSSVMDLIDGLRTRLQEENSKIFLSKKGQEIYEGAIRTALALEDPSRAFQIAEKAKANLLYASLKDRVARSASSLPADFLNQEYDLKRGIALLELQLKNLSPQNNTYHSILAERASLKAKLNKLIAEIEQRDPSYFALKYQNKDLDVAQLRRQLPDSSSLVEYFAGEKTWYMFVLTKDGIHASQGPRNPQKILRFSRLFITEKGLRDNLAFFENTAFELYKDLVSPIEAHLGKYVNIIPDAELNYLPFDVLFTEKAGKNSLASTYPYWVRKKAISYNFSARLWLWTLEQQTVSPWLRRGLMVFAPDFDPIKTSRLNPEEQANMQHPLIFQRPEMTSFESLPNMSSSQEEARRLGEIPGTQIWSPSNSLAVLGSFLKNAPRYRFIHLATHAKFDSTNHRYSYLAFRPVDNGADDERLYLDDLYRLQLPSEMVVLSACETQLGEFFPGEGNASLARGFAHAGVKSVVATRWSIKSESKARQMALFYHFLKEGHNKAEALRLSKLEILSQGSKFPSPYYWAAPVVMGDTCGVSFFSLWSWQGIGLVSALLFLFVGLLWMLARKLRRG